MFLNCLTVQGWFSNLKAALADILKLTKDQMNMCNVKVVTHSEKQINNYDLNLHLSSALHSFLVSFSSGTCKFTVFVLSYHFGAASSSVGRADGYVVYEPQGEWLDSL